MLGKGSKLYSILRWKCARCHEGDMFCTPSAYSYKNIDNMYKKCPSCGENYWPEPGFYYGSMYVSYGVTIATSVTVFVAMMLLWKFDIINYLILNTSALVLTFPWVFRTSRVVWLNIFVDYEEGAAKKQKAKSPNQELSS